MDLKDKLLRYEELKRFEQSIEEEIEELGKEILQAFDEQGSKKSPELKFGRILVASKKSWRYSAEIAVVESSLKELKSKEQALGLATESKTKYLKYQPNSK